MRSMPLLLLTAATTANPQQLLPLSSLGQSLRVYEALREWKSRGVSVKTDDLDQMDGVLDLVPGQRQLFVDELHVETKRGIITNFHQAQKKGAIIRPYGFGNLTGSCQTRSMPQWNPYKKQFELPVLGGDPASQVHNPNGQSNPQWFVSKDGVQWSFGAISRPPYVWEPPYQYLITGEANASRMYKTIIPCVGGNMPVCGAYTSSDGINWTAVPGAAKIATSDEQNLSFDNKTGEFIYSVKRFANGRAIAIATTTDFYASQWTDLGIVFQADEEDQHLGRLEIQARLNDSSLKQPFATPKPSDFHVDVYNMGVFKYESVYMGLPAMYHAVAPDGGNTLGFHLIKAVTSRNLKNWTWLGNRSTFITPSKIDSGAYDLMQMLPPSNVLIRGDLLWMYYSCMKTRCGSANAPLAWHLDNPDNGAICLATIRRDGFVSLVGGPNGGTFETSLFKRPTAEQRLCVNADAGAAGGELRAELLDKSGMVLSSALVQGDATHHTLEFDNFEALDHGNEPVRLRFTLSPGVHLYSYWLDLSPVAQVMSMKTDDDEQESPQDVHVTLTFTNSYKDTDPMSNPLAGLPALPKTHHSWPIYSFMAGAQRKGGAAEVPQWPTLDADSPILLDYARITHSLPLDLNWHGGQVITAAIVREVVFLCAKANASLSLNWSPYISFCQPGCKDPRRWGPEEQKEINFFGNQLSNITLWLRQANDVRPAHTNPVTVGAILIDQEAGWSTSCANRSVCCDPADPIVKAMIRNNNKVYSTAKHFFPEADVEQYGRGGIRRCSGLGDWERRNDPAHANACWVSTSAAVWRGDARGPGNEDVQPVACAGYTLLEKGDSFNPQFYNVGDEYGYGREAFNRTAVSALANGVRWVNPWIWLGGGAKLIVENWAGRMDDFRWSYETINSWMLGAEINNPYYGDNPTRFALWGMTKQAMFYPSIFEPRSVIETPCGNCSVALQHFVAYVHGAANITRLAGTPACSTPSTRACDCLSKEYGLLSVDPGS